MSKQEKREQHQQRTKHAHKMCNTTHKVAHCNGWKIYTSLLELMYRVYYNNFVNVCVCVCLLVRKCSTCVKYTTLWQMHAAAAMTAAQYVYR